MIPFSIERYEKSKTESGSAVVSQDTKKEVVGPTLQEILADKENSRLFGELLCEQKQAELAERMSKGELTNTDLERLGELRNNFVNILEQSKNLRELLTQQNLEGIITTSLELQKIAGLVGPEGIKVVTGQLEKLMIQNPTTFEEIKINLDILNKNREVVRERDKEISDLCKKYNIDETELAEILRIQKGGEYQKLTIQETDVSKLRQEEIKRLLKERAGFFRRTFKKGEIAKTAEILTGKIEMQEMLRDLDASKTKLGEVLAVTMSTNPEMRRTISSILKSENPERTREKMLSFPEMMREVPSEEDFEEEILNEWKKYKKEYNIKDNAVTETNKNNFWRQFTEKKGSRIGFWGIILGMLFEILIDGFDNEKLK